MLSAQMSGKVLLPSKTDAFLHTVRLLSTGRVPSPSLNVPAVAPSERWAVGIAASEPLLRAANERRISITDAGCKMDLSLRLTPFGFEQRGSYFQPDRHDEYYEDLFPLCSRNKSSSGDCCCISFLLLGDQNAGKTALQYALVATRDVNYTAFSSLLPFIQAEFSNRRELLTDTASADAAAKAGADGEAGDVRARATRARPEAGRCFRDAARLQPAATETTSDAAPAAGAAGTAALNSLILRARDELPFLDSDVARSAALLTSEDFAFFCTEFGIQQQLQPHQRGHQLQQRQQQQRRGLWSRVLSSRYVLLHFIEFGGDHLDRMHAFWQARRPGMSSTGVHRSSSGCSSCSCSTSCVTCDQAAAAAVLLHERASWTKGASGPSATLSSPRPADLAAATTAAGAAGDAAVAAPLASQLSLSLRTSFSLAEEAPLLVYFVNCSKLFTSGVCSSPSAAAAGAASHAVLPLELDTSRFLRLLLRLHSCCAVSRPLGDRKRNIHFVCSRLNCLSGALAAAPTGDAAADAASGCCCRGFDEKGSFCKGVEALKRFVSFLHSQAAHASPMAAASAGTPATEKIAGVERLLNESLESLYSRFLSCGASATSKGSSSCCERSIKDSSSNTDFCSWVPFEDCWGKAACASVRAEEEQLQQCVSVSFLSRLLQFVWSVCSPVSFCRCLRFRGVSAVKIIERSKHQDQQHQQQQRAAWGPDWQLCVPSVVLLIVRLLVYAAEGEGEMETDLGREIPETDTAARMEAQTEAGWGKQIGKEVNAGPFKDFIWETGPGHEVLRNAEKELTDGTRGQVRLEQEHQEQLQERRRRQQLQSQEQEILTGEMGRQLVALFLACVQQQRERQQQHQREGEVSVHLWLSAEDWRAFVADFDPTEQHLPLLEQPQTFVLPATGEVVTVQSQQQDNMLMLLPAAAAAAAFAPLVSRLASLGLCLPACLEECPWAPLVLKIPIQLDTLEAPHTLLLLAEALQAPLAAQQQQQRVYVQRKDMAEMQGGGCFAAVRMPFHPSLAGLVDRLLALYAREALPSDFWSAAAISAAAAAFTGEAGVGGFTDFASASCAVEEAMHATSETVMKLLPQLLTHELQQEPLSPQQRQGQHATEGRRGIVHSLVNGLQLLLHLAGDVVLLRQMASATATAVSAQEALPASQEGPQWRPSPRCRGDKWTGRTEGPYVCKQQIYWVVELQPPDGATAPPPRAAAETPAEGKAAVGRTPGAQAKSAATTAATSAVAASGQSLQKLCHSESLVGGLNEALHEFGLVVYLDSIT